jgi:16S rRNA (guanine966-N2)-methyltransferase
MKIIAGTYKGKNVAPVPAATTRPTTAKVREAWASIVSGYFDFDLSGLRVLDAFAGSGAQGLELLSRGAEEVVFCDLNQKACRIIHDNIQNLGSLEATKRTKVLRLDVLRQNVCARLGHFDVVILDPPYQTQPEELSPLFLEEAFVSYEHAFKRFAWNEAMPESVAARLYKTKVYGNTAVTYLSPLRSRN